MLFLNRFDADSVLDLLPRATVMMGVPTFYTRLLASPRLTREACAGMRLFVAGPAPLLADTFKDFEARTAHRIPARYGLPDTKFTTPPPRYCERKSATACFHPPAPNGHMAD